MREQASYMNEQTLHILYTDAINLLKKLISTSSLSKEEDETAEIIQIFLESKNVVTHQYLNNIWAKNKYFDESKPTILLNSHHDTVKPNKAYTLNPFEPIEKEGKLFGLGSNDAGGSLVSLINVFLYFYPQQNLKCNFIIAATAEEEISGPNGVEILLPRLSKIGAAALAAFGFSSGAAGVTVNYLQVAGGGGGGGGAAAVSAGGGAGGYLTSTTSLSLAISRI
jgi:acetylornithine deacetylase